MRDFRCVTLLAVLSLSCARTMGSDVKIMGGTEVTAEQNQGVVAATAVLLDATGSYFCSGTLIAPRIVVTAAHCVKGSSTPKFVTFTLRSDDPAAVKIPVESSRATLNYGKGTADGDFGYVLLSKDAAVDPVIVATMAEEKMLICEGCQLTLVGYGSTALGDTREGIKRLATTNVAKVVGGKIQTAPTGSGTCHGDSGGPAFAQTSEGEWRLVGIASTGLDKCTEGAGTHCRAAATSCWIGRKTGVTLPSATDCEAQAQVTENPERIATDRSLARYQAGSLTGGDELTALVGKGKVSFTVTVTGEQMPSDGIFLTTGIGNQSRNGLVNERFTDLLLPVEVIFQTFDAGPQRRVTIEIKDVKFEGGGD